MNYKRLLSSFLLVFTLGFALLSFSSITHAEKIDLAGWGWSSNIGWVSLNCTNTANCGTSKYEVSLNPLSTNVLGFSGWGWSSNVGWVKFAGDTNHPSPKVDTSTGRVSGFIRVCSGTVNKDCVSADRTDGWDGWIQLSDSTFYKSPDFSGKGGVTLDIKDKRNYFKGYSWGSDVVGWFKFDPSFANTDIHCIVSCVDKPPVITEIKASCTIPSYVVLTTGKAIVTPTVTVSGGKPPYSWSPLSFTFTSAGSYPITVNVSDSNTDSKKEIPVFCGNIDVVNPGTPTVTINAKPKQVDPKIGITDVSWIPVNASNCTALGDWNVLGTKGSKSGTSVEHTERQTGVNKNKTYRIFCSNQFGDSPTVGVTVSILGQPTPTPGLFSASCPYDQNIIVPKGIITYTVKPYTNPSSYSTGNIGAVSVNPNTLTFSASDAGHSVTKQVNVTDAGSNQTIKTMCEFRVSQVGSNPSGLPTVYITATTNPVDYNSSPNLIWTPKNADSCVASNLTNPQDNIWSGSKESSDGQHSQVQSNIITQTTYSIKCTNSNGSATASITVGVNNNNNGCTSGPNCPGGGGGPIDTGCTTTPCTGTENGKSDINLYIGSITDINTNNIAYKVKKPAKFLLRWVSNNLNGYSCTALTKDLNASPYGKFGDWNPTGLVTGSSNVPTSQASTGNYTFQLSCSKKGFADKNSNLVKLQLIDASAIEEK